MKRLSTTTIIKV